jgi:hypothetical protein
MPVQELQVVSPAAEELLARVDRLLDEARAGRECLERTFMDIAIALDEVEKSRAWLSVAHSYDAYIKFCEARFGKSRTQLYGYRSVAKNLLPAVSKEQLLTIGISKAMPLAQYSKRKNGKLPASLINKALDGQVGVEEFKAAVAETQHEKPERTKWFDMQGFYVTADEKIEIEAGLERAETIEPLPDNCPDWLVRKIVVQRLIAEFLSTYPCTENGQI